MPSQVVRSCVPAYMEVMPLHIACNVKTRYPTRRHNCRWNTIIALYWPDWIIIMPSMKQQLDGYTYTRTQRSVTYMEVYPFRLALGVTQGSVMGQTKYIYMMHTDSLGIIITKQIITRLRTKALNQMHICTCVFSEIDNLLEPSEKKLH